MPFEIARMKEEAGEISKEITRLAELAVDKEHTWTDDEEAAFRARHDEYTALRAKVDKAEKAEEIKMRQEAERLDREKLDHEMKKELGDDAPTEADRDTALRCWMRTQIGAGDDITEKDADSCRRAGINPGARNFDFELDHNRRMLARRAQFMKMKYRMTVGATEGGEFIPEGFVNSLEIALLEFGGMRQVSEIIRTATGNDLPWPHMDDTGTTGRLLTEATAVTEGDIVTANTILQAFKYSSDIVFASAEILQDSAFDLPTVIGNALGVRLGRIMNTHFTVGTGTAQPRGLITAAATGFTTATNSAILDTELMELVHSVDPAYRNGAGFMMHDSIVLEVRKLQDAQGRFVWQDGLAQGVPDTLLSYPVTINQDMASALATTNDVMAFGRLSAYKIREVVGVRMRRLVERYADTDEEGFVGFMRADGDYLDAGTGPVQLLTMAV